jgi:hypothetical protein
MAEKFTRLLTSEQIRQAFNDVYSLIEQIEDQLSVPCPCEVEEEESDGSNEGAAEPSEDVVE